MKNKIKWFAVGLLGLSLAVKANIIYNTVIANESALAYNNTYVVDLQNTGINQVSAQATYSSATIPSSLFTNGSQSTGSITVNSFTDLIESRAVNQISVATTTGLYRATLSLPGFVLREGTDWSATGSTATVAQSLKTALTKVYPPLSLSVVGSVIYATAPVGSNYNSLQMQASVPAALVVTSPYFQGGRDNASVRINGISLLQGTNFTAATSNNATAASLSAAINANSSLAQLLTATPSGPVVSLLSKINGLTANFALISSTPTALAPSGAVMINGTNSAVTLGSTIIRVPLHSLTAALPVLYGAPTGTLGGLVNQTTYYAIIVDANNVKLANSAVNALLGSGIIITSTSTQLVADVFTLAPLPISGVPSFKWQVSNDNSFWNDLSVSSITLNSYSNPPENFIWSFGYIGTRYVRLNVVAPTTGGLNLVVRVIGTN